MNHVRFFLYLCPLIGACSGGMIEGSSSGVPGTGGAGNFGTGGNLGSGGAVEGTGGAVTGGSDASAATGGTTVAPADGSADQPSDGLMPTSGPPPAIDYSIWQLQLPTGSGTSPTTVGAAQLPTFSNAYFFKADDGGQIFMDPVTGVTTQNSVHPRTELREMSPGGGGAAWSAAGTNTMTVKGKVLKGSSVTIAQVFNGPDSITLAELQYSSGGFTLFYEEARGQGGSTGLGNAVPLNTPYTFTMSLTKNILTVAINGKSVFTRTPSARILGSKFYFKVGNYDQTTSQGAVSTTARSTVEVYSAEVVHQ